MKYFLRIVLVLFLATATVTGVYYYTTGNVPAFLGRDNTINLTTVSKPPVTEKYAALTLLGVKENYVLYKSGDMIVLDADGKRYEFLGWTENIDLETPEMYLANIDDDADDELIIRAYAGTDINDEGFYEVYVLNRSDDPTVGFDVIALTEGTADKLVSTYIFSEIAQLENCKKTVQLAMVANTRGAGIVYDNATGIATNAHTGYFRALQNEKGEYLDVAIWNRGTCRYTVDEDGAIHAAMDVLVSYSDTSERQQAGVLSMDIRIIDNTDYTIADKSIRFTPNPSYAVSAPTLESVSEWSYTEINSSSATSETISWLKHKLQYEPNTLTQTVNAADELGDMNAVASVRLTSKGVILKAKGSAVFDKTVAASSQYSVMINMDSENEYDIAYICTVSEDGKELSISFDRAYKQEEIESIEINFGTK